MSCPRCRDIGAALAPRGPWPDGSPQAALAVVRSILDRPPPQSVDYGWASASLHRSFVADEPRTEAFRRALEAVVRPGDVVIDLGAGTGILAAFAARAGAREVHAIERSGLAVAMEEVMRRNDLQDVVKVHTGDAAVLDLPRARVLVSEWLGNLVFGDGMWPAVVAVRERCLEPGGVLVPASVELFLAPVEDAALRADGPGWWDTDRWGLDLRVMGDEEAARPVARIRGVLRGGLLAPAASVVTVDCARAGGEAGTFDRELTFEATRDGTLDGLAGWFSTELAPGVTLDTGPDAPETHWRQYVLPTRPAAVRRGQRLEVRLMMDGERTLEVCVTLEGRTLAHSRYW